MCPWPIDGRWRLCGQVSHLVLPVRWNKCGQRRHGKKHDYLSTARLRELESLPNKEEWQEDTVGLNDRRSIEQEEEVED
jgi:hypothetical protein